MDAPSVIGALVIIVILYYFFMAPPASSDPQSHFDPNYDGHRLTTPFVPPPIAENKFYVTTISGPPANNIVGESLPPPIEAYKPTNRYGTHREIMENVILSQ